MFRKAMHRLRPTAMAAHAAAMVGRKLPTYREAEQPLATLPDKFKVIVWLTPGISKGLIAAAGMRVAGDSIA